MAEDPEPEPQQVTPETTAPIPAGLTMDELQAQETVRMSADLVRAEQDRLERMVKRWGDQPEVTIPRDELHARVLDTWRQLRTMAFRSRDGWKLDPVLAKRWADATAKATMDALFAKLKRKVGELTGVEASGSGYAQFTVRGVMADGRRVQINQQVIVNTSSLGKVFNQFPARIYVDGQLVSERQYQRALDAARPPEQQAEIEPGSAGGDGRAARGCCQQAGW